MDAMLRDVRYAVRMLYKNSAFTITAALVIALGTTALTTVFSVVNRLLLTPPPGINDARSLVEIGISRGRGRGPMAFSYPLYKDLQHRTRALAGVVAMANGRADVSMPGGASGNAQSRFALIVSGNYFDVLRVRPAAGRFFAPDEDSIPLARPVTVLGWRYATERFGSAGAAVGQGIDVNGTRFTVIGVAPEHFGGTVALLDPDFYTPAMMLGAIRRGDGGLESNRNAGWMQLVGRLAPGVSREAAQAELTNVARQAEKDAGNEDTTITIDASRLMPVPARGVSVIAAFMGILFTLAALVLLIACMNVGNMLLARGLARRKEFVVRLAVGAGRFQLVRQLLTESVLLFLLGGAAGVALTVVVLRAAGTLRLVVDFPVLFTFAIDLRVLAFTLVATFAIGLLFGLAPALAASRRDLAGALRSDSAGLGERRERSRNAFVVAQLAMSVLLLVSAGLFLRALGRATSIRPGYDWEHVAAAPLGLRSAGYDSTRARLLMDELAPRVASLPGVAGVSFSQLAPLAGNLMMWTIELPGHEPPAGEHGPVVGTEIVGRDFFSTLRLPLIAGRTFDVRDVRGAPGTVIVTEGFVRAFWPEIPVKEAVGRTFTTGGATRGLVTVIGIVGNGRFVQLTDDPGPFMFLSDAQQLPIDETLLVRATGDPARLTAAVRQIVQQIDPRLPRPTLQALPTLAATGLLPQRVAATATAVLGVLGLVLAAVGVYGVISYGVGQRTREIGVRMALGATQGAVVGMVVGQGRKLALIGLGIGLTVAVVVSRLLSRFLLGVSPLDPITLGAVPIVLLAVTVAASWLPARRAARIDAVEALREG